MAGIYIHIPFCKKRCVYCDFFSSTHSQMKDSYVEAVCKELEIRRDYLQNETIETIYFGGGTPSQLNPGDFEKIFQALSPFALHPSPEITLEANPDDLTSAYVDSIRPLPFNRVSVGIQSFNDKELKFLNRRHNAETAIQAVKRLQEKGFANISIDLMYGLPGQNETGWRKTIRRAKALSVQHISAYHLTYEENAPLYNRLQKGLIRPVEEEMSVRLFEILMDEMAEAGFEHYEISNFAQAGYRSKHNASYWNGTHYLGIGASAHSYDGQSRQWNVASIPKYIESQTPDSFEIIDEKTAYNDFILTRLRTAEGIDLEELTSLFGEEKKAYCFRHAHKYVENQYLEQQGKRLSLTRKGIFVSDGIMSDLFFSI
ncbi:MAG: radical SAM family heme chaperone HemW [Dysgonamonadaceae bacterium]|jgi:oxygen-independent coproporphyrinogen-3 oxidase|nr:radical SAM family heme chaperone HemW [Dysgonamonadaceae bacterium]